MAQPRKIRPVKSYLVLDYVQVGILSRMWSIFLDLYITRTKHGDLVFNTKFKMAGAYPDAQVCTVAQSPDVIQYGIGVSDG